VADDGSLLIDTAAGEIRQDSAFVYQEDGGKKRRVDATYAVRRGNEVSFRIGEYDQTKPLIIDPVLSYSTYLGGSASEHARSVAVDLEGSAYVTGVTASSDFPVSTVISPGDFRGNVFVSKLNSTGTTLVYSVVIGGNTRDEGLAIAVDPSGNAFVTGITTSPDFPTTGLLQPAYGGGTFDAFVTKVNTAGTALVYSTYLGGTDLDHGRGVTTDSEGNCYITGTTISDNFPTTTGAISVGGFSDAFLTKIDPSGAAFVYSARFGGADSDSGSSVAIDPDGNAYVTGSTASLDFPTVNPIQQQYTGGTCFKSVDSGDTWTTIDNGLSKRTVRCLAIDPKNDSTAYAGVTGIGICKSTDGGGNWNTINSGLPFVGTPTVLVTDPLQTSTVYAAILSSVFKSTNGGGSWANADTGLFNGPIVALVIDPVDPSILYTALANSGVFKSTNSGESWVRIIPSNRVSSLAVDPVTHSTIYVGVRDAAVFRSTDGGSSWFPTGLIPIAASVDRLVIDPATPTTIYTGTGFGVLKTTNGGGTWASTATLPLNGSIDMTIDPVTPTTLYVAITTGGVLRSDDSGDSWEAITAVPLNKHVVAIALSKNNSLYVGTARTSEAFVTKVNASGSAIVYSTYLGGSDADAASAIAIDGAGNTHLTGSTFSTDFPLANALQADLNGGQRTDGFVAKLDSSGSALVYSTYLGGTDFDSGRGIAVDQLGNAYITGDTSSQNFPTSRALQPTLQGLVNSFLVKINPSGAAFLYSTFLGGELFDSGFDVAVDQTGGAYIVGSAISDDFPTTIGAFQTVNNSFGGTSFVARIVDSCFDLSSMSQSFAADGGAGIVNLSGPLTCGWTATSNNPDFLTITNGGAGSGDGTIEYSVAPNIGTSTRTGTISIENITFTIFQGIQFTDVPEDHPFYTEIGKLSARGVTLGCGPGVFCPDQVVTREQMAAFIIRGLGNFNPRTPTFQRFADVPPINPFYAFIDALAVRQITLGCGGGNYCPSDPVLREQMAAFIIRALHEPGYTPPVPAQQRFVDVPPTNPFYGFIDEMAVRQITLGCGGGNYCPANSVTRGQMAAFLVRAFNL
jgi:photosystem II stability/assembly factor-like uncharacterized protein